MDMQNITKITLAWELHEQGVMQKDIAAQVAVNRDTLRLWFQEIGQDGLLPFLDRYTKAKKGPRVGRQIDALVKRYVWEIREREMECCGEKIQYYLERDRHIHLAASRSTKFLQKNIFSDRSGRRIKCEELFLTPCGHERSFRWIRSILASCLPSRASIYSREKQIF